MTVGARWPRILRVKARLLAMLAQPWGHTRYDERLVVTSAVLGYSLGAQWVL
jgi:hypothetical protein